MSDLFSKLVNLQSLTLSLKRLNMEQHHTISCPQLLNLYIKISCYDSNYGYIKVVAPKLCSFSSLGILSIMFVVPELENVTIKLHDWFGDMDWMYRKIYYWMLTEMLSAAGNAKNLTFDLDSIKALAATDFLASLRSPFSNLKIVKLPLGYKESSMSSVLRSYLLGASPRATIVTTLPQSNMNPQKVAVSMTAQNALLLGSLEVPTKDMNVQKEHVLEDSVVADRARHIDAPVEEIGKDQVSSLTGNGDFGVWLGYKVNPEFICLLDRIMHKYPETFENFTSKNKKLCTMNLNILCTSLNDFTKISMTEVDSEMISGYKDVFAYLKNQGFNVSWALRRLNFIERLRYSKPLVPELHAIDCRIENDRSKLQELQACVDDVKIKLQDLQARVDESKTKLQAEQTLRMQKLIEIEKAFGTVGTKLAVGFIGNDLLSCD
ncbi:hypothetical protein POM88_002555 [Heracleum sosnowskyi]|uniref:Uncharacterized protein n=1 Tax=Heracleum sosnowskyi TaxID=360622 RepID=A0AAD8JE73_9APIA|nr:hypothetical protein POM88_002555 [Heracleum sosnowskyi]